ncbi:hypothetical protein OWV82_024599 [Melia azedarach]|uniref:Uncharacterized protein n=1 Tax=Melia azedarach TaxID=155640 RepID=A0ACC1WQC0_MELAZ|nr:hypothetical protein OWV82_024599 [Melia azedarach]
MTKTNKRTVKPKKRTQAQLGSRERARATSKGLLRCSVNCLSFRLQGLRSMDRFLDGFVLEAYSKPRGFWGIIFNQIICTFAFLVPLSLVHFLFLVQSYFPFFTCRENF